MTAHPIIRPHVTVALDPSVRDAGLAAFGDAGRLVLAAVLRTTLAAVEHSDLVRAIEMAELAAELLAVRFLARQRMQLVSEWPQVHMAGRSKGPGSDLLPMAGVAGSVAMALRQRFDLVGICQVVPSGWKGQMTKDVVTGRVTSRLSEEERAIMAAGMAEAPPSVRHNAIEAVGIGLWKLGRFAPDLGELGATT